MTIKIKYDGRDQMIFKNEANNKIFVYKLVPVKCEFDLNEILESIK